MHSMRLRSMLLLRVPDKDTQLIGTMGFNNPHKYVRAQVLQSCSCCRSHANCGCDVIHIAAVTCDAMAVCPPQPNTPFKLPMPRSSCNCCDLRAGGDMEDRYAAGCSGQRTMAAQINAESTGPGVTGDTVHVAATSDTVHGAATCHARAWRPRAAACGTKE